MLVVVDAEPLQLGEDLDSKPEQQPLGGASGDERLARARAPQVQALLWLVFVPLLALAAFAIIRSSQAYIRHDSPVEAFQAQQSSDFSSTGGTSDFTPINPFSPAGLPLAIVTVNFRPFPWEAGGLLPAVAALEGIALLATLLVNWRGILAGLRRWRSNGMVILAVGSFLSISVILSALSNFGLLARERTQVLPFLFMLPCMVRVTRARPQPAAASALSMRQARARAVSPR